MKISLLHPSRQRVSMALQSTLTWLNRATDPSIEIEYFLSIDDTDPELEAYRKIYSNNFPNVKVLVNSNRSAIDAINNAAKVCTGDILIVVSDDFDCPGNWDRLLKAFLHDKEDFIVKVEDGIQSFIITIPIMDRIYYNRFNYIYYPEYLHMFCDSELSCVAYMLDKCIRLDLIFKHNHYIVGGTQHDKIYEKNDDTWKQGETLFHERKLRNFDLVEFIKPYKEGLI